MASGRARRVAAGCAAAVVASAFGANAQDLEQPISFTDRPLAVMGVVGGGTLVGTIGALLDYTPAPALSLGAGAGSNFVGPQFAAYLRARPFYWERRKRALAIAMTGALSTGPYQEYDLDLGHGDPRSETTAGLERAVWMQLDVSFELRARSGFGLVAGFGYARLVDSSGAYCRVGGVKQPGGCGPAEVELPTLTVMLGYAFDFAEFAD
jgi:hypothetical protein